MKVDKSNPAELLNWIWERIDDTTLKEKRSWIDEQLDKGDTAGLASWGIDQLDKVDQAEVIVIAWVTDTAGRDDASLSKTVNDMLEFHYDNGKNRIEAWRAINLCLEGNQPLPEWAKEYLLQVSQKMLAIDTPGKNAPQEIYKAVGIRGHEFTQAHQLARRKALCLEIERLISEDRSKAAAYRIYAKAHNLKEAVVKGYHIEQSSQPAYRFWLGIDPPKSK